MSVYDHSHHACVIYLYVCMCEHTHIIIWYIRAPTHVLSFSLPPSLPPSLSPPPPHPPTPTPRVHIRETTSRPHTLCSKWYLTQDWRLHLCPSCYGSKFEAFMPYSDAFMHYKNHTFQERFLVPRNCRDNCEWQIGLASTFRERQFQMQNALDTYIHTHTNMGICVCVCTCVYICIYSMCVCVYMYIHTYAILRRSVSKSHVHFSTWYTQMGGNTSTQTQTNIHTKAGDEDSNLFTTSDDSINMDAALSDAISPELHEWARRLSLDELVLSMSFCEDEYTSDAACRRSSSRGKDGYMSPGATVGEPRSRSAEPCARARLPSE